MRKYFIPYELFLAKLISFCFLASVLLTSCSKDDDEPDSRGSLPTSEVFGLAKTYGTTLAPFYYKNTTKTSLDLATNEQATVTSIYVNGEDVYVTGNVTTTNAGLEFQQACYWKNNVKVNVSHSVSAAGGNKAMVEAITIIGSEVFAVGNIATAVGSPSRIVLWRNGISSFVSATSSSVYYYATSISVFNNDVYVSGNGLIRGDSKAALWKNGVVTELSSGLSEVATVIANANGVHTLFLEYGSGGTSVLKYRKNDALTTISSQQPSMGDMNIKGNDVYVTGAEKTTEGNNKAFYWKNGAKTELVDGNNKIAGKIKFGRNGDIFIAEKPTDYRELTYWKNKVKATLGNSTDEFLGFDISNKF